MAPGSLGTRIVSHLGVDKTDCVIVGGNHRVYEVFDSARILADVHGYGCIGVLPEQIKGNPWCGAGDGIRAAGHGHAVYRERGVFSLLDYILLDYPDRAKSSEIELSAVTVL